MKAPPKRRSLLYLHGFAGCSADVADEYGGPPAALGYFFLALGTSVNILILADLFRQAAFYKHLSLAAEFFTPRSILNLQTQKPVKASGGEIFTPEFHQESDRLEQSKT